MVAPAKPIPTGIHNRMWEKAQKDRHGTKWVKWNTSQLTHRQRKRPPAVPEIDLKEEGGRLRAPTND